MTLAADLMDRIKRTLAELSGCACGRFKMKRSNITDRQRRFRHVPIWSRTA